MMADEESNIGANNYRDRAIKAFASCGIHLNPQQLEGEPYKQLTATLDFKEGARGQEGVIWVTFASSSIDEQGEYLEIIREIGPKGLPSLSASTPFC